MSNDAGSVEARLSSAAYHLAARDAGLHREAMIAAAGEADFQPSGKPDVTTRIFSTENVRIEHLRCHTPARVRLSIADRQFSLLWVRDRSCNAHITIEGAGVDSASRRWSSFWFFPEGVSAKGELSVGASSDCVGVSVLPKFIPPAVKSDLVEPIMGFSHDALGHSFSALTGELAELNEALPAFREGFVMQALAYVAKTRTRPRRRSSLSGLAPWQLRRATDILVADMSESPPLNKVAAACRVSVSHFSRAFKISTGAPPHQWLTSARIALARTLLENSQTPLVEIAAMCGFADQSHFSRVFGRFIGTSPGSWRRTQMS